MEGSFRFVEGSLQASRPHLLLVSARRLPSLPATPFYTMSSLPLGLTRHASSVGACPLPTVSVLTPRLQAPGREFDAVCAPFRLDVPDFVF